MPFGGIHPCRPTGLPSATWSSPGFTLADGILVEGNKRFERIYDNLISSNKNGIRLIPTLCGGGQPLSGGGPSVDGPHSLPTRCTSTTTRSRAIRNGLFSRTRPSSATGLPEALNNLYMGNDFRIERRMVIYLTRSRGTVIDANYFEQSPRQVRAWYR